MKKLLFIVSLFVFQSILFSVEASGSSDEEDASSISPRSSRPTVEASGSSDEEDASLSAPRNSQPTAAEGEYVELEQAGYFDVDLDEESFLLSRRMVGKRIRNEYNALKAIRARAKADARLAKGSQTPEIDGLSEKLIETTAKLKKVITKLKKLDKRNRVLESRTTPDGLVRSMEEAQEIESELKESIGKAHRIINAQEELAKRANAEQVQYLRKELLRSQGEQLEAFRQIKNLQSQMKRLQKECERLRGQPSEKSGRASEEVMEAEADPVSVSVTSRVRPLIEEPLTARPSAGDAHAGVPTLDFSRVVVCQSEVTDARDRLASGSQDLALRHNRSFTFEDIYPESVARNFGLLGAEYIQPDSPIAMEMFVFNFNGRNMRAEVSALLRGARGLGGGDNLKQTLALELMMNERMLLTLNSIDAAFSREDKINSIFQNIEGKGPENTAAFSFVLKGYRAFFYLRVDFLRKLLNSDSRAYGIDLRSLSKFEFLKLDGSIDESNKLANMTGYIENLTLLFNDVRDEFFEISVPLDILMAQDSAVVSFSQEHQRLMDQVGGSFLNRATETLKNPNYHDSLKLGGDLTNKVQSNIKGYMDPKTYLIELANALRRKTSVPSLARFLGRQ